MAIKNVLVVDDSATDRFFITSILERAGFTVTSAESGEECLARAEVEMPDLIVMDVLMPGMNGFQATRALTKASATANIPVVLCSGKAQLTDRAWALRMGARECIVKPVVEAELLALIATLG